MDEDLVRQLVRASIARHLGDAPADRPTPRVLGAADVSHFRYTLPESGGPCLIEPTVTCNHCGFCQSHGY